MTADTYEEQLIRVLKETSYIFGDAVIAGGAIRDHVLGRPVKDIDVFVQARYLRNLPDATPALFAMGWKRQGFCKGSWIAKGRGQNSSALDVVSSSVWNVSGIDYPVNVVELRLEPFHMEAVVDRLDLGFCRFGLRLGVGDRLIHYTDRYAAYDIGNQVMTVVSVHDPERSYARHLRLLEKYPGWGFVPPPGWVLDSMGALINADALDSGPLEY